MTPGKEGPGKGKNITVLADFFPSGREYQNCLQISTGVLESSSVLWFYSSIILIGYKYYIYKANQLTLRTH